MTDRAPGTYIELGDGWDDPGWTRVPNTIARCRTISRGAKGLVLELASHAPGRRLTIDELVEHSTDGRDATRARIRELEAAGFLTRSRERDESGRLGSAVYRLHVTPQKPSSEPTTDFPTLGNPTTANPVTNTYKTKDLKDQRSKPLSAAPTSDGLFADPGPPSKPGKQPPAEVDELFEEFWRTYPRKTDKKKSRVAWGRALKGNVDPRELINAAARFAQSRRGEDPRFTAHPSTWLNGERWNDEPAYARNGHGPGSDLRSMREAAVLDRMARNVDGDF